MSDGDQDVTDTESERRYTQILNNEIDLEIGLRERLQKTIEGRIQWATFLQDALTSEHVFFLRRKPE